MNPAILGIHHVTSISSDARKLNEFYSRILGLRLVKRTVNFDDPGSYHLYFGDELGRPGTIVTFFAWPGAPRGRRGSSQVTTISLAAPGGSLDFWQDRLAKAGVLTGGPFKRFGEEWIGFYDFDGLGLEIVSAPEGWTGQPWGGAGIPPEHALRGIAGVSLTEEGFESTAALLTSEMGMRNLREEGNRFRFAAASEGGATSGWVDVLCAPDAPRGRVASGTVHHLAFRVNDDVAQEAWRRTLAAEGYNVSPVMDRHYFRSIYFREPGGILFELATDPPGFTADERPGELGSSLKLPRTLEPMRSRIEAGLPQFP